MAWRRNLQVSSVGTSAERLGVGADHDGGRAAGAKGAATEETRKGLRLRILPGTGCHRAGPPSKSGARAGGGRSDDFTQSNCGGTEAELATSATTCLHPQPPSRAYICVRNQESLESIQKPRQILTDPAKSCQLQPASDLSVASPEPEPALTQPKQLALVALLSAHSVAAAARRSGVSNLHRNLVESMSSVRPSDPPARGATVRESHRRATGRRTSDGSRSASSPCRA